MRRSLDELVQRLPPLTDKAQREATQYRDVQHLEHIAFAECTDKCVGDDIVQELRSRLVMCLLYVRCNAGSIEAREIDVHSHARLEDVYGDETDDQRNRGQDFEIDQGL